jgi:hypothetical protein
MVLLGLRLTFGSAICIRLWKPNARRTRFCAPSTAPQATPFGRSSGLCIVIVLGVLGVMSPVVVRNLLDAVALAPEAQVQHQHDRWRRQRSGEKIDVMCREWLIREAAPFPSRNSTSVTSAGTS